MRTNVLVGLSVALASCGPSDSGALAPPDASTAAPACSAPAGVGSWVKIPMDPSMRGRDAAYAWTGKQLLAWGGLPGLCNGRHCGLSIYDPADGEWRVITPAQEPGIRDEMVSVWAGDRWILFGGKAYANNLELTPGILIYTPTAIQETDGITIEVPAHFREVNASGEPTPRQAPSMFWTGHEALVWGGSVDLESLRDGGLFDPETEAWRPMSANGAPTGGGRDVAGVWTGERFLVWGTGDGDLPTGGQYDPETDTWSPINLEGPPPRVWHSMVWGGGEAYVYGGQDTTGNPSAGEGAGNRVYSIWAYTPATDCWRKLKDEGRSAASKAVWSNGRLVMWGGTCAVGSSYDPGADSWTALSVDGVPSPRSPAFSTDTPYGALFYAGTAHLDPPTDGGIFSF